jgi:hypothetical protein
MKAAFVAAAAAAVLSGGVSAGHAHARHAHDLFKVKRNDTAVCTPGCTTVYTTITGSAGRTWKITSESEVVQQQVY